MKIAVIAANGKAGQAIVKEAVARGHEVTAIVRSANQSEAQAVLQKDLFDLTREDLLGFDVVVNAFGAWTTDTLPLHQRSAQHLVALLEGSPVRLLVVGGAGSLYLDESHQRMLMDSPDFPAEYLPVAVATGEGLSVYRQAQDIDWLYISPAADFLADGEQTGNYLVAGEVFTLNAQGRSQISYRDYALALVDEIEQARFHKVRISVLEA